MNDSRHRPDWVDPELYPFRDRWMDVDGSTIHYVDEGTGVPVLMLHGNPTWSFLYRNVIQELGGSCRCIAPDYPGFGLSDHPPGYGYTPEEHADRIGGLVDALGLDRFVLVLHDWGGPIGVRIATERAERLRGLVLCNSWCWPADAWTRAFSMAMGGPWGRWLHMRHNVFARFVVPAAIHHVEKRTPPVLKAYTAPFPTPASRTGTWAFPRAIRTSAAWLAETESRLGRLRGLPVEMVWAMRDPAFGHERYIRRWHRYFPGAPVERVEDASHYLQEDRPDRVVAGVRRLLARL